MNRLRSRLCVPLCCLMLFTLPALRLAAQADWARPERGAVSREPATSWEKAFVTGNGTQGALYHGLPGKETVTLNHALLFLPLGNEALVPDLASTVPELRRRIGSEGHDKAMLWWMEQAKPQGYPGLLNTDPFHPGLQLELLSAPKGPVRDYLRSENFATGEISVSWSDDLGPQLRRLFVSRADNVVVLELSRAAGAAGNLDAELRIPPVGDERVRAYTLDHRLPADAPEAAASALIKSRLLVDAAALRLENAYAYPHKDYGFDGYDAALRVVVEGGSVERHDRGLRVSAATRVLVLARIAPCRPRLEGSSRALLESLERLPADYGALLAPHARLHGELFSRIAVDFADAAGRARTTDELLAEASATGKASPALLEKMYDGSRHVILCSSGIRPPNLQGIWTGTWQPAWSGDYTTNTNLQLAIAHHYSCGTPELLEGYFKLVEDSLPDWRLNARRLFGARGVLAPTRQSTHGRNIHWSNRFHGSFWTPGAGWLAHWFQEHHRYTGDRRFLEEKTMPLLREIALFYEDFLIPDDKGRLLFRPSKSAENGSADNATQDIMVAREVLGGLIANARLLGSDADRLPVWQSLLDRLPPYHVDPSSGELLEWSFEGARNQNYHRHMSHLYGLFQSRELDRDLDPALWTAAVKAYEARLDGWLRKATPKDINSQSSHGRMHLGLIAARLGRGAEVGEILDLMAASGALYPSMAAAHYERGRTFNVDANGGIPEILNNALADCWDGTLRVLPALPPGLPRGAVRGLRLRGGITVGELSWNEHGVSLSLLADRDAELRIIIPDTEALRLAGPDGADAAARPKVVLRAGQPLSLHWTRRQPAAPPGG